MVTRPADDVNGPVSLTWGTRGGYHAAVSSEQHDAPRTVSCPTCGARATWRGNPQRPFCSLACRLIDLGQWLDEHYRVAGDPLPDELPPDDRSSRRAE
jgi:endogenous inhibitor of DNA gyrase (YacG/DUF329 family)